MLSNSKEEYKSTFNSSGDVEESVVVMFAQVPGVQPTLCIESLLRLVGHVEVTHEDVTAPEADLPDPLAVLVVQLRLAPWDLFTATAAQNNISIIRHVRRVGSDPFERKSKEKKTYLAILKASATEIV